jgi:hypothetical protein
MKTKLSIDFNYIDEGIPYQVATKDGITPFVRINKSAFDNIDIKYTKRKGGRIFLACPQSAKGLLNFLPVQFVYKRIVTKNAVSFIS